jgi:glycosyltransferase involved in cell wall biosynthesis
MKIGYFASDFPYKNPLTGETIKLCASGGVENVTYNLAVQMAKRGHNVFIFTSSADSKNSIEDYGKIKVYRYKKNFNIGQAPISFGLLYNPLFFKGKLDIIHSQFGNLPAPIVACIYSIIKKKKLITTYHEDYLGGFGSLLRRFGVFISNFLIADCLLYFSDIVLTPSEYYIEKSKHLRHIIHKVNPIHNGINLDDFDILCTKEEARNRLNLPLDKKIILFVGGLTPRKAPEILLKSMKKILNKSPDAYLVFVGDGYLKPELQRIATEMGISQHVKFSGFISEELKPLYYHSADIFTLPSLSEGFGIVLLEASASGLPLIVSDLDVFKSVIKDEHNGIFTKTGDEVDLADKIIFLLENADLRIKMGNNAKENAKNYSWEHIAEKTEKIYCHMLS